MTVFVFRAAVFLGAYLLFLIQPLSAKLILPWFGGGPAVWSTALLFFQVALVVGYGYAHVTRRLGTTRQAALHMLLLAAAVATLSIVPSPDWEPPDAGAPVSRMLTILGVHIGAPFVLLAATAPLLQDWRAQLLPDRSPYRLYALSNIGSLLALVSFPLLLEPLLSVGGQATWWSVAFVAFALACGWCALRLVVHPTDRASTRAADAAAVSVADQIAWLGLPATGAALLLATTNRLTQDVAAVPLLWIVPLALYLGTYIAAFTGWYRPRIWCALFVPAVTGAVLVLRGVGFGSLTAQAAGTLGLLVTACMICHGEVARRRPPAARLTEYYLALAVGGGLGGAFVAVVAPAAFDTFLEVRFLYVLAAAVAAWAFAGLGGGSRRWRSAIARAALTMGVVVVALAVFVRGEDPRPVRATARSFYGVVSVVDDPPGVRLPVRYLYHGQILHGVQFRDPALRRRATAYYVEGSGLEIALNEHPAREAGRPLTVGVIGLGAGTVAAWGRAGDQLRFFEIDPDVVAFAQQYFTFLADSPADIELVMGDGRLSLERDVAREGSDRYDVLVLDAFSGDAIPVHLLTREAFAVYDRALKTDGFLVVNISNRYLDLRPVVRGLSAEIGLEVRHVARAAEPARRATTSNWLIATRAPAFLARYPSRSSDTRTLIWTDAYSSILRVLR